MWWDAEFDLEAISQKTFNFHCVWNEVMFWIFCSDVFKKVKFK